MCSSQISVSLLWTTSAECFVYFFIPRFSFATRIFRDDRPYWWQSDDCVAEQPKQYYVTCETGPGTREFLIDIAESDSLCWIVILVVIKDKWKVCDDTAECMILWITQKKKLTSVTNSDINASIVCCGNILFHDS